MSPELHKLETLWIGNENLIERLIRIFVDVPPGKKPPLPVEGLFPGENSEADPGAQAERDRNNQRDIRTALGIDFGTSAVAIAPIDVQTHNEPFRFGGGASWLENDILFREALDRSHIPMNFATQATARGAGWSHHPYLKRRIEWLARTSKDSGWKEKARLEVAGICQHVLRQAALAQPGCFDCYDESGFTVYLSLPNQFSAGAADVVEAGVRHGVMAAFNLDRPPRVTRLREAESAGYWGLHELSATLDRRALSLLIIDAGAGTIDASVLRIKDDDHLQLVSNVGLPVGGSDLDVLLCSLNGDFAWLDSIRKTLMAKKRLTDNDRKCWAATANAFHDSLKVMREMKEKACEAAQGSRSWPDGITIEGDKLRIDLDRPGLAQQLRALEDQELAATAADLADALERRSYQPKTAQGTPATALHTAPLPATDSLPRLERGLRTFLDLSVCVILQSLSPEAIRSVDAVMISGRARETAGFLPCVLRTLCELFGGQGADDAPARQSQLFTLFLPADPKLGVVRGMEFKRKDTWQGGEHPSRAGFDLVMSAGPSANSKFTLVAAGQALVENLAIAQVLLEHHGSSSTQAVKDYHVSACFVPSDAINLITDEGDRRLAREWATTPLLEREGESLPCRTTIAFDPVSRNTLQYTAKDGWQTWLERPARRRTRHPVHHQPEIWFEWVETL